jgi:hypothetical protein
MSAQPSALFPSVCIHPPLLCHPAPPTFASGSHEPASGSLLAPIDGSYSSSGTEPPHSHWHMADAGGGMARACARQLQGRRRPVLRTRPAPTVLRPDLHRPEPNAEDGRGRRESVEDAGECELGSAAARPPPPARPRLALAALLALASASEPGHKACALDPLQMFVSLFKCLAMICS